MSWQPLSGGKNRAPRLQNAKVYSLTGAVSPGWSLLVDTGAEISIIPFLATHYLGLEGDSLTHLLTLGGKPIVGQSFYVEIGHSIAFSIDNTLPNRIGFKFTMDIAVSGVPPEHVRRDLLAYVEKVQSGESLDDLPVILPLPEHNVLLAALLARIKFLQDAYESHKNLVGLYASLLKEIPKKGFEIVINAQQLYLQSGEKNQITTNQAVNSPQAAMGVGNRVVGNKSDQQIHIGNSFIERKQQIDKLETLEKILRSSGIEKEGQEAALLIAKAKDELEKSETPDPPKVLGWLETAKHVLKALALTQEVSEAAKKVYEAFKLIF